MNKVVVELVEPAKKPTPRRSNNAVSSVASSTRERYEGWVTSDYVGAQLRNDVTHYWQLDENKYELLDGVANAVVSEDTRLDSLAATCFLLRKRRRGSVALEHLAALARKNDPFWLQEKLFDVFLIHALPHWNGKGGITMSCYQFKQLVLKAMARSTQKAAPSTVTPKRPAHDLMVRVVLAFKTATPNYSGAGASFDEFLDALLDVAACMFPRTGVESKERALEQLAARYLIPYYDRLERDSVHHVIPSWCELDELVLKRPKVRTLVQRYTQPLFEIALAYSTSITGPRRQRGLQFHEFSRLVHDTKPSSTPLTALEVCFCFIHCCRVEIAQGFTPSTGSTMNLDTCGSMASLNAGADGSGRGVLEISCFHAAYAFAYLALVSMPRLALTKTTARSLSRSNNQDFPSSAGECTTLRGERVSSKLAVLSVKAFLHFMSIRLRTTGRATAVAASTASPRFASMKKDTTLPLVSVNFQQEFLRMHREDSLEDYLSSCYDTIRQSASTQRGETHGDATHAGGADPPHVIESDTEKDAPNPEQDEDLETAAKDADDDLGLEIDWGDEGSEKSVEASSPTEEEDHDSPAASRETVPLTPEALALQRQHEREVLRSMQNDADEIYLFLAGELLRQSIERRLDDTETVPQMLDIWVTAGQKYAQVISYLDSLSQNEEEADPILIHRKARVLERFGASLFVFAMQLLRSTSKVFHYEELFHVTNVRVYSHVKAELWDETTAAAFTIDLATETLSLASGKLGSACKLLEKLHQVALEDRDHSDRALDSASDDESDDDDVERDDLTAGTLESITERYMQCLLQRANCLNIYGDVLAHSKRCLVDFDLGCVLEEDQEVSPMESIYDNTLPATGNTTSRFFTSSVVLSKSSSAGQFYREAKQIYRYLLVESKRLGWDSASDRFVSALHGQLASVEFKLATHLPRGCLAEKRLLDDALQHLATLSRLESQRSGGADESAADRISAKTDYIGAVRALRTKFFQPETEKSSFDQLDGEAIVPFYRFVLVAVMREIDSAKTGSLTHKQLSHLNEICGRGSVSNAVMAWLLQNFDHHDDPTLPSLTEKGLFQYFCWLAEADPLTFCDVLDILTAKHTGTPVSITSGIASHTGKESKGKSLRATLFSHDRHRASASVLSPSGSFPVKLDTSKGLAECVVVVSAKMAVESCGDISATTSPSDVRLEPFVIDVLPWGADVPDELSKFCFPDDPFMASEPLPPKTFDIVLTDITGARNFGSCLQFFEEKDPIDVLAMISGIQRGSKTTSLPSWVSLKEIQQRKTKARFFIPKCVCILSKNPLFQTFRDCLATLYRLSISLPPFPIESFVFNILEQVSVPTTPNSITSFSLVDHTGLLSALPPAAPQLYPSEVDFTLLFQSLSAENVLKVYSYLLTERKVVLCSQNGSILTPIAETFRALLHPFDCQAVYIPVLPLALLDFVTAPVPFFMGVRSDQAIDRLTSEGVVVVYLDRDEVAEPTSEELPALPEVRAKKLLQSLRKTSAWATSQRSRRQYGRYQHGELSEVTSYPLLEVSDADVVQTLQQQEDLQEKWTELYLLFTTFTMRLLKDFRKYCHRSRNSDGRESVTFDKKGFLAMHPSQREFCAHLFQTQHFQRFIDNSESLSESVLQLAASDAEQSWRHVRAKSIMLRRGDSSSDGERFHARQITRAPAPIRIGTGSPSGSFTASTHRRRPAGRHAGCEILAPFNCHIYDDLRGVSSTTSPSGEQSSAPASFPLPPLLSPGSSGTLMASPRSSLAQTGAAHGSSNLVVAARLRLDAPIEPDE